MSDLALVGEACACADAILERYLRIHVAKALRLASPEDFDRAVAKLAALLRARATPYEEQALTDALRALDVDWPSTTSAQRRELLRRAAAAAKDALLPLADALRSPFKEAAEKATDATRRDVREAQGLDIDPTPSAFDRRVQRFMLRSQTLFVRDAGDLRVSTFGQRAREIVAGGMDRGLGRADIGADLEAAARQALVHQNAAYWEVVAAAFMGRSRSYTQIGCYAEAGITRYRIEAVMDERTSETCRRLHGRVFSVQSGLAAFARAEALDRADKLREVHPWPRKDPNGMHVTNDGGRMNVTARTPTRDLEAGGLGFPPYHGLCRTTTIALT